MLKLLELSGSSRKESFNKKLIQIAAKGDLEADEGQQNSVMKLGNKLVRIVSKLHT